MLDVIMERFEGREGRDMGLGLGEEIRVLKWGCERK